MTLVSFVVAMAILVAVHELGHYGAARLAGVKVVQFSIGFGPRLIGWTSSTSGTEFVVGLIPLGGYVKMLDEREGPVAPQDLAMAFNAQPLKIRALIVAAGPLLNLFFAVLLYTGVHYNGVQQAQAILSSPVADSAAAHGGLVGGERVVRAGFEGERLQRIDSFEQLRWLLSRGALTHRNIELEWTKEHGTTLSEVSTRTVLKLQDIDAHTADLGLFERIGIVAPFSQALLGELLEQGAAAQAGLRTGDLVLKLDQSVVVDASQLRTMIRRAGQSGMVSPQSWLIERAGVQQTVLVTPKLEKEGAETIARVGAFIGAPPALVWVRYGLWEGLRLALEKTWEISGLSLKMMANILTGQASWKNLSGPVTIADYAAKSAAMGLTPFILFLAWVSVSLGVFNLLPVPVLDGGHLMYYLWESLTGRAVSALWMERLQKLGLGILIAMMSVAVFNDLARLWG